MFGKLVVVGINAVASNPVLSIAQFATWVIGTVNHLEEKRKVSLMEFYSAALHQVLYAYSNMFTYGKYDLTLDELQFCTATYLNIVKWQNELALKAVSSSSDKQKVQAEINEINTLFAQYLVYQMP